MLKKLRSLLGVAIIVPIIFICNNNDKNYVQTFKLNNINKNNDDNNKNEKKENLEKNNIDYDKFSWDLNKLYKNDTEWIKELNKFEKDIKELRNYCGKITKSSTHISFALDIKEKLDIRIEKLYAYVNLKKDINKNSHKFLDMENNLNNIYLKYNEICSGVELEILNIDEKDMKKYLKDDKISKKYRMYIQNIKRSEKNYLTQENEKIVNMVGNLTTLPKDIYELFINMDKKQIITPTEYARKLTSADRKERKTAFENEFVIYNDNINTLSGLLIGQVKKNMFYSNIRNYKSSKDMYLKNENIDEKVYDNLLSTVNKNLNYLHKYTDLRKKVLNIEKVHYYDMFAPIIKSTNEEISYDKAQGIVYAALNPLGKEYGDVLYRAFNERWIDVYPNNNKVSGAYCLSNYGANPYVLLNYNNTLNSVSTLAHELGHAVYDYFSNKNQNYYNSSPTIFTQEIASVTNESLLYETLIKNSSGDKTQKAYYLTKYIDLIKDTLYVQTMYAEFEEKIHQKLEKSETLNVLVLNDLWGELLQTYYGDSFELDPLAMVGWSRIPHFYNSFYVYKYATGCSAAISFTQDILTNPKGAKNYTDFLKRGGSEYPLVMLKQHGIDLKNNKFIDQTINKFASLVKELEETLK